MKHILLSILMFLMVICSSLYSDTLTTGGDIFKIPMGARGAAMGNANTAIADDVEAVDNNMAGLAWHTNTQIMLEHSELYQGLRYEGFGIVGPLDFFSRKRHNWGVIGLNFQFFHMESFDHYDVWGTTLDQIEFSSFKVSSGYSRVVWKHKLFALSGGALFSLFNKQVYDMSVMNTAFDVSAKGIIYLNNPELKKYFGRHLYTGLLVRNINLSTTETDEDIPFNIRFGIGSKIYNMVMLNMDFIKYFDSNFKFNLGAEYFIKNIIGLRIGGLIGKGRLDHFAAGIGVKYPLFGQNVSFDYAMVPYSLLGVSHRVSMKMGFSSPKETPQDANIYYYKGVDALINSDYEKAVEMWERTLDIDPNHPKAKESIERVEKLIEMKNNQKDTAEVEEMLKKYIQEDQKENTEENKKNEK